MSSKKKASRPETPADAEAAAPAGQAPAADKKADADDGKLSEKRYARELKKLHVELVRVDVLGDPLAHALHRANEVFAAPRSPHHFSGLCNELCAEPQVARSCTRFEQGLKLPRLCPALVVGKHGAEGSHERPLAPLWS